MVRTRRPSPAIIGFPRLALSPTNEGRLSLRFLSAPAFPDISTRQMPATKLVRIARGHHYQGHCPPYDDVVTNAESRSMLVRGPG